MDESESATLTAPPLLSDRLTEWASTQPRGERAAVAALIEEGDILARQDVRDLLVVETGSGAFCDWTRLENRYRPILPLTPSEDAFLTLLIAIAFPRHVPLWRVEDLGDRRLAVVLRALARLACSDTIAVGART